MSNNWHYVGRSTNVVATTTGITLTEPPSVMQGDLLVACIAYRAASTTNFTLPANWNLVQQVTNNNVLTTSSGLASGVMAWTIRGASAPSFVFTKADGASVNMGQVVAYRNAAQTSPLGVSVVQTMAINTTAISATGFTTAEADDLLVAMVAGGDNVTFTSFNTTTPNGASSTADMLINPDTTWRERADNNTTSGADTALAIFDVYKATASATGNFTCTASGGAGHVVIVGAFKLGGTGGSPFSFGNNPNKSYQFSNTTSDLTGGGSLSKSLVGSGSTAGTWSGQSLGAGGWAYISLFTPAGEPGTDGQNGFLCDVMLYVSVNNGNLHYGAQICRVNSSGVVQAVGPQYSLADSGTGTYFLVPELLASFLGTWASGDRIELRISLHNPTANVGQSCTIELGSDATISGDSFSRVLFPYLNQTTQLSYGGKNSGVALSGGNLVASSSMSFANRVYTMAIANIRQEKSVSGKYHWEVTLTGYQSDPYAGITNWVHDETLTGFDTLDGGIWMEYYGDIYMSHDTIPILTDIWGDSHGTAIGDIIAFEYDNTAATLTMARKRGGTTTGWITPINVATGVEAFGSFVSPHVVVYESGDILTCNFDGPMAITPQAGYTTWAGVSLGTAHVAAARFLGAGSFSADTNKTKLIESRFAGAGSLSVEAQKTKLVAATFAGAGGLQVAIALSLDADARFAGAGSFQADTSKFKTIAATFSGQGNWSALANVFTPTNDWVAEARFAGAGSFSADTQKTKLVAATFAGAGSLSANTQKTKTAAATFAGAGSLQAAITLNVDVDVRFTGFGSFSADTGKYKTAEAIFSGQGSWSIEAVIFVPPVAYTAEARFAGSGSFSADVKNTKIVAATFAGAGNLQAAINLKLDVDARFSGAGSFSVDTQKFKTIAATFEGEGDLRVGVNLRMIAAATFAGEGILSANTQKTKLIEAIFNGLGSLAVDTTLLQFLRPDADDLDGSWTNELDGTNLFPSVSEVPPPQDADYIKSGTSPVADIARLRLSDPGHAGVVQPMKIRVRYRKTGAATVNLTVRLKQGVTEIASWNYNGIADTFVTAEETLTAPQFASITNFSDLFVELQADAV